jgi:hypothetical protein
LPATVFGTFFERDKVGFGPLRKFGFQLCSFGNVANEKYWARFHIDLRRYVGEAMAEI